MVIFLKITIFDEYLILEYMDNLIFNYRATIFSKRIDITNDNVVKLTTLMRPYELLPTFVSEIELQLSPFGIQQVPVQNLELKRLDGSLIVKFSFDRIDVVRNKITNDDNLESIEDFSNLSYDILSIIITEFSLEVSRIALCSSSTLILANNENVSMIYPKLATSIGPFNNEYPEEWELRQVHKIKLTSSPSIIVNYSSKIARVIAHIAYETLPSDRIIKEYDFNTNPQVGVAFNKENVRLYFDEIGPLIRKYEDDYMRKII